MSSVVLLTVMLVLAAPLASEAECAWVLWRQTVSRDAEDWNAQEAFTDASECKVVERVRNQVQERYVDSLAKSGTPRISPDLSWLCLPDTVDPRGAKGK